MKRWTKKSIREMRSQIDGFVLRYDLPGNLTSQPRAAEAREWVRGKLEEHKRAIVIGGLSGFRNMLADRAKQEEATSKHWRESMNDPGDVVGLRFEKLAAESRKSVAYIDRLIERIRAEGLPPEVLDYVPERIQG